MSEDRDFMEKVISNLKQQRDELALQLHLGKEEAKDEWDKVESKLAQLNEEFEPVKEAIEESAGNVFASLKLLAGEVIDGFHRVRTSISDDADQK